MSEHQALIAQLRAARESWVDLGGGKAVRIRRPAEAEFSAMVRTVNGQRQLRIELPEVKLYVTGWRGFTEADLLGAGVGNSDVLPFDAEVWAEVVADHTEWLAPAAEALLKSITDHAERTQAAAGNSQPTSTPAAAPTVGPP